jgi:hypothetical protein
MQFHGMFAAAGAALVVSMLAGATLAATDAEPIQATWKEQEISFVYVARTSFYSCRSIEDKIEWILEELGARKDLVVRSSGCMGQNIADTFTNVRIKVAVPVVGAPGSGLEPGEKARRELVARVRGEPSAEVEAAEQFPAAWTTVRFSRRSRYVDDGDCELLEQLATHVFPKLELHIVREKNWCIPGQVQFGQLNLEVEALKALPKPDDKPE